MSMYSHPFNPYDVQKEFMKALYTDLNENEKIVLFESPTGTGKTFSLLCPSLSFIRDVQSRTLKSEFDKIDASGGPNWMRERAKQLLVMKSQHSPKRVKTGSITKIVFASRTHSQLAQVASALRKIKIDPPVKYVQLGSRQHLCVNENVYKLKNPQLINEKCAELQKNGNCPYRDNLEGLKQQINMGIMDIEDMFREGVKNTSCAYYAARESSFDAEVIALPYALLLVAKNREALGIDLSNSVVIVDEAHNLIESLSSLHSKTLTQTDLKRAKLGLKIYLDKVGDRLSPPNKRSVLQFVLLVESLLEKFNSLPKNARPGTPVDALKLLEAKNADTLNVPSLNEFMNDTKLMFKVDSYSQNERFDSSSANCLGTITDFLLTSMDPLAMGKLFIDLDGDGKVVLRYLVLDTSPSFKEIVDECGTVVLAGGTMEPTSEFHSQLFPYINELKVHTYGHIVPAKQLLVMPISGMKFTFTERGKPEIIRKLGETLISLAENVPNGMVVFFPGYAYLDQVVINFKKTGLWDKLIKIKPTLYESKNSKADIFTKYSELAVKSGAILLAVVGGRLSEGINFSDDLARAVVMVGIPYPNAFSAEMVAKKTHIEKLALLRNKSLPEAKEEAKEYYENLAMRQVNQSVGRAIRHINDYAALFLIDDRFTNQSIKQKLSRWVRDNYEEDTSNLKTRIQTFFKSNL